MEKVYPEEREQYNLRIKNALRNAESMTPLGSMSNTEPTFTCENENNALKITNDKTGKIIFLKIVSYKLKSVNHNDILYSKQNKKNTFNLINFRTTGRDNSWRTILKYLDITLNDSNYNNMFNERYATLLMH